MRGTLAGPVLDRPRSAECIAIKPDLLEGNSLVAHLEGGRAVLELEVLMRGIDVQWILSQQVVLKFHQQLRLAFEIAPPSTDANIRNCWFQPSGSLLLWGQQTIGAGEFAAFMHARGLDRHSLLSDPKFVDPVHRDYRMSPDSPARPLGANGKSAGALPD